MVLLRFAAASFVCCMFSCAVLSAQDLPDRRDVRKGNRDFKKENYKEAEIDYRKALVKDSTSFAANYNLGNTLYRMNDMQQAAKCYESLKEVAASSAHASDYYYNVGNVASSGKDWQAAVDAYKEALLRNPGDMDAKENYIYARQMLKNQQDQQNQQNQDNKDNKDNKDNQDQNKDQQNQDQNQDNNDQDQQDKNDQNRNDQNQDQQQQQGSQPKITPQAAQQMLQAIQAKEKETQDKVNKEKAQALKSRQKEKNW